VAATGDGLGRRRALPGVTAVGATTVAPLWAGTEATGFNLETGPAPNAQRALLSHRRTVTPGYFDAMRMPIVAGRSFDARDAEGGVPVVIVSQSLAQRYWPGQNPIGKRVKEGPFEAPGQWREVVGVVGTLRENPGSDIPEGDAWYLPHRQDAPMGSLTVVVRSGGSPAELVPQIRAAVSAVDRELAIADASTLDDRFARFTATERLSTRLTLGLGGIGLFLAAIGIYGLLSFTLGRRLPEFGIRAALGARPSDVRRLIARDALVLLGAGVVIGVGASLVMRPWMDTSMFPGADTDLVVVAAAAVGLAFVTLLSSLRPALKAGRVDPVRAMHGG
jgi:putative ABC transport system permease protein